MSLDRFRRSSRAVAALLLLVSTLGLPHRSKDDSCLPFGLEEHDESKHVFKAVAAAAHQDHCAICHWTRWLKPDLSRRTVAVPVGDAGAELIASTSLVVCNRSRDRLPPRAPPAADTSFTRPVQLS